MSHISSRSILLLCALSLPAASFAAPPDHWVGTWAASPVAASNTDGRYGAADTTYREIVHVSLGGSKVRVLLTNEFGTEPLTIAAARVALSAGGSDITPTAERPLAFGGRPAITIPAGAMALSDPVDLKLPTGVNLAVSLFIPAQTIQRLSLHTFANQTNYFAPGNVVGAAKLDSPKEFINWPFLKGVDVLAGGNSASIVAFGDSITDGAHSTLSANTRWPDVLAQRLQADKKTAQLGILNEGIGGNRVLHDVAGPNAPGALRPRCPRAGRGKVSGDSREHQRHRALGADREPRRYCHRRRPHPGSRPVGRTRPSPRHQGLRSDTHSVHGCRVLFPAGETMRQAINHWIKTTNQLDGFIDFDKATQDPRKSVDVCAANDSGDHLHPNDTGYKAMANSIDLKLFTK